MRQRAQAIEPVAKRKGALRKMSGLIGFSIMAKDGEVGTVDDFYFNDENWTVRYLVVNTGGWLSGKMVLLSPEGLDRPNFERKEFPVKLTRQQVENSPLIETDRPVTRQHQLDLYNYYGWGNPQFVVPTYNDAGVRASVSRVEQAKTREYAESREKADPHLRSAKTVGKYGILATDGKIGHVEDFIIGDGDWSIEYLDVDTRDWLPGKHVLIPYQMIKEISLSQEMIHLDLVQEAVRKSPEYDHAEPVTGEYEESLRRYYRIT